MSSMTDKTTIYYFNKGNGEKIKLKDCTINKTFIYKRCNFTVVNKYNYFFVCYIDDKGELYNIWSRYDIIDGEIMSDNQIMSLFRKEYDKNNITVDLIKKFLEKPLKTSLLLNFDKRKRVPRATKK